MRPARLVIALLGAVLLASLLGPAPALAHAILVASSPADGSLLAAAPPSVRLVFSESVQPVAGGITVIAPSGRRAGRGRVRSDGVELSVDVHAAERGTYVVIWQVIAVDTHPSRGRFLFSVGRTSAPAMGVGEAGGVSPLGLWLQVAARTLHFAGYALGFGPLAFRVLVLQPLAVDGDETAQRRLWRTVSLGLLALLLAEPLALLAQTASLGTAALFDPTVAGDMLTSSFGRVLAQRLGAAALLWVLIGIMKASAAQAVRAAWAALALALALALVDGQASHAVGSSMLWLGLGLNAAHVAAMGLWAGGLVSLLRVWRLPRFDGCRGAVAGRFGRLAAATLALLVLSGALMAVQRLARPDDLTTSAYGRVLVVKLAVVLVTLLLALAGLRARRDHQPSWWRIEAMSLLGVLVVTGLLVSLPPPA